MGLDTTANKVEEREKNSPLSSSLRSMDPNVNLVANSYNMYKL